MRGFLLARREVTLGINTLVDKKTVLILTWVPLSVLAQVADEVRCLHEKWAGLHGTRAQAVESAFFMSAAQNCTNSQNRLQTPSLWLDYAIWLAKVCHPLH